MTTKAKQRAKVHPSAAPIVIKNALADLRSARDLLRDAGCKNAADYVARAMKSAEGALRHAESWRHRTDDDKQHVRGDPLKDRAPAFREGWGLFECGDGQLVIEADNECRVFRGANANLDAYAFVEARAEAGSPYHKAAIELVNESAEDADRGDEEDGFDDSAPF
jgi:hypothetical protein